MGEIRVFSTDKAMGIHAIIRRIGEILSFEAWGYIRYWEARRPAISPPF